MAIRVINVSGGVQKTDTKQESNVKVLPGKHIDLDSHLDIGITMREQIKGGLFKVRDVPVESVAPKSVDPDDKKKAVKNTMTGAAVSEPKVKEVVEDDDKKPEQEKPKKGLIDKVKDKLTGNGKKEEVVVPPVDLKALADSDVSNDDFIKAVMRKMIADDDNLGRDGKPNQPPLEAKVMELRTGIHHVKASRRDRLFEEIEKEDNSG